MNPIRYFVSAAAIAATLGGAAWADESRDINVSNFKSLDAGGQFELVVTMGQPASVHLEADDDDADDLKIHVDGDELEIEQKSGLFGRNRSLDATVTVTMPALQSAEFSRGLEASVSGLDESGLDIEVSTGANVTMSGRCDTASIEVSTGGMLDAENLQCASVNAEASTGGQASVFASESLSGEASLGGQIEVFGDPQGFDFESSLGGEVTRRRN